MQFKVPQDVQRPDRIVGPLTISQLIITVIGGAIAYSIYAILIQRGAGMIFWLPPVAVVLMITAAFAFLKIANLPFYRYLALVIERFLVPTKRSWVKGADHIEAQGGMVTKEEQRQEKLRQETQKNIMEKEQKLKDLKSLSAILNQESLESQQSKKEREKEEQEKKQKQLEKRVKPEVPHAIPSGSSTPSWLREESAPEIPKPPKTPLEVGIQTSEKQSPETQKPINDVASGVKPDPAKKEHEEKKSEPIQKREETSPDTQKKRKRRRRRRGKRSEQQRTAQQDTSRKPEVIHTPPSSGKPIELQSKRGAEKPEKPESPSASWVASPEKPENTLLFSPKKEALPDEKAQQLPSPPKQRTQTPPLQTSAEKNNKDQQKLEAPIPPPRIQKEEPQYPQTHPIQGSSTPPLSQTSRPPMQNQVVDTPPPEPIRMVQKPEMPTQKGEPTPPLAPPSRNMPTSTPPLSTPSEGKTPKREPTPSGDEKAPQNANTPASSGADLNEEQLRKGHTITF